MKKLLLLALIFFSLQMSNAQFIKEKSLNVSLGLGFSYPDESATEAYAAGFLSQAELILKAKSWLELRPYAGFIYTDASDEDLNGNVTDERVETTAFYFGGKGRLRAPIPYVAPFIEIGVGVSIGSFITSTIVYDVDRFGVAYHIPLAFGLELGKNHNVDLGFMYLFHPGEAQFSGALSVGVTIPLNK